MRRAQDIVAEEQSMRTILTLTGAFEGLSSMRITQIKDQVVESRDFFADLWQMYSQLRVNQLFNYGRDKEQEISNKDLFIGITAEGGFSGDIDQRLIEFMLKEHRPEEQDIIIIGHHGAVQLSQLGVTYIKYFRLPAVDKNINVAPLIDYIQRYKTTSAFYQSYSSLMVQDIKKSDLHAVVQAAGTQVNEGEDVISEINYIFEPSSFAVVAHLERIMLQITLSQMILESKLAQHASRYRAMSSAQQLALDTSSALHLEFNRVKRSVGDQRLKEIIGGLKLARSHEA